VGIEFERTGVKGMLNGFLQFVRRCMALAATYALARRDEYRTGSLGDEELKERVRAINYATRAYLALDRGSDRKTPFCRLTESDLAMVEEWCRREVTAGRLVVLEEDDPVLEQALDALCINGMRGKVTLGGEEFRAAVAWACNQAFRNRQAFPDLTERVGVPILRAGVAMTRVLQFLGMSVFKPFRIKRLHADLKYVVHRDASLAFNWVGRKVLLLDPMGATGGSFETAILDLLDKGVRIEDIQVVCIMAAPECILRLRLMFPGLPPIMVMRMVTRLSDDGYLVVQVEEDEEVQAGGDFGDHVARAASPDFLTIAYLLTGIIDEECLDFFLRRTREEDGHASVQVVASTSSAE